MNSDWSIPLCSFPPVLWWKIHRSGGRIDVARHYVKQTMRNRYTILSAQGPLTLTIPVQSQGGIPMPYHAIRLENSNWAIKHWRTIQAAYGKSAYFEHYQDHLSDLFHKHYETLLDFNTQALLLMTGWMKIPMPILDTTVSGTDLSPMFEPSFETPDFPKHIQVFMDRLPFASNISILDACMNLGPYANQYLSSFQINLHTKPCRIEIA